jgi:hypothetical protein
MIKFKAVIKKFQNNGEKTGWTYIEVPNEIADQLKLGNKKSFKVKGILDSYRFEGVNLLPMGEGDFIMALNATIRKEIKKQKGDSLQVQLEIDTKVVPLSRDFTSCLEDEPKALSFFKTLPGSHQRYFSNWIESAKTDATKTKRITQAVIALSMKLRFNEMVKSNQKKREV